MKENKTIVLALAFTMCAAAAEFKAGFARVDVTPPLGIPITGYFYKRIASLSPCRPPHDPPRKYACRASRP